MGITSRFVAKGQRVEDRYKLPEPIFKLFERAPSFGMVYSREQLHTSILPFFEEYAVEYSSLEFSLRPAWTGFYSNPNTHVIVIGHILLCHALPIPSRLNQPSLRLFTEDAKTRADVLHTLIRRATARRARYA